VLYSQISRIDNVNLVADEILLVAFNQVAEELEFVALVPRARSDDSHPLRSYLTWVEPSEDLLSHPLVRDKRVGINLDESFESLRANLGVVIAHFEEHPFKN